MKYDTAVDLWRGFAFFSAGLLISTVMNLMHYLDNGSAPLWLVWGLYVPGAVMLATSMYKLHRLKKSETKFILTPIVEFDKEYMAEQHRLVAEEMEKEGIGLAAAERQKTNEVAAELKKVLDDGPPR